MTRHTALKIGVYLITAALLVSSGWYAKGWYDRQFGNFKDRRVKLNGFEFTSPLLDVELPKGYNVRHEPIPFKHKVEKFITQQVKSEKNLEVSVYYRDLSDGPWFGLNENVEFDPASLMKVPVMICWLKRAEQDPAVLKKKLTFNDKNYAWADQGLKERQTLTAGSAYSIEELLRYMIHFSDNKALHLLYKDLSPAEIEYVTESMDINSDPHPDKSRITVHSYSGFLRILYNASFLSREMSEKALKLMSFQNFQYGIIAGIPKGVRLSSKYGFFQDEQRPDVIQLHEFGIVYHPNGPYILGVLTRGSNFIKQAEIIKTISEIIYTSVTVPTSK